MTNDKIIKECCELANAQNLTFRRSERVNTINGRPCFEIESGIQFKTILQGCLVTIWEVLLSEILKDQ